MKNSMTCRFYARTPETNDEVFKKIFEQAENFKNYS